MMSTPMGILLVAYLVVGVGLFVWLLVTMPPEYPLGAPRSVASVVGLALFAVVTVAILPLAFVGAAIVERATGRFDERVM